MDDAVTALRVVSAGGTRIDQSSQYKYLQGRQILLPVPQR